jgi:hypothetical protein
MKMDGGWEIENEIAVCYGNKIQSIAEALFALVAECDLMSFVGRHGCFDVVGMGDCSQIWPCMHIGDTTFVT